MAERRNDIDWLRIGATYLLFPFHAARPFDHLPWHLKNAQMATRFDLFVWFVHQFHMPLFFTLAGWSMHATLGKRTLEDVRRERGRRLLVPFVFGVLTLSPPQAYVEAVSQRGFTGSYVAFQPYFFTSLAYFSWHHLWFLLYLYVFTLLYLPLLSRLELRPPSARPTARHLYLALIPFAAAQVALRWHWPGSGNIFDDWANFTYYSLFFLGGFLVARLPELEQVVQRERRRTATLFLAAVVAMLPLLAVTDGHIADLNGCYPFYWVLSSVAGVCGVSALLGYGRLWATRGGRVFAYLRESALPVYILHQPVIVVGGYWFLRTAPPLGVAYVGLVCGALALTLALYQLVIQPVPPLRRLFGLRT